MPVRGDIIAIVAWIGGGMSALVANALMFMMIRNVNRVIATESRLRCVGVTPPEFVRIFREYRRLFPNGRLHLCVFGAMGIVLLSFLLVIVAVEL